MAGSELFLHISLIPEEPAYPYPDSTWRSYSIPLSPVGGWEVSDNHWLNSSRVATEADIRQIFSDLTNLRILGNYGRRDTGDIDNVVLEAN